MINSMIGEADIAEIPSLDFAGLVSEDVGTVVVPETDPPLEDEDVDEFIDNIDHMRILASSYIVCCIDVSFLVHYHVLWCSEV